MTRAYRVRRDDLKMRDDGHIGFLHSAREMHPYSTLTIEMRYAPFLYNRYHTIPVISTIEDINESRSDP